MKMMGYKHDRYVCPEDFMSQKHELEEMNMGDIIELKAVDMNYGYVPMDKDDSSNLKKASDCNLERFNLKPKDKPSEY